MHGLNFLRRTIVTDVGRDDGQIVGRVEQLQARQQFIGDAAVLDQRIAQEFPDTDGRGIPFFLAKQVRNGCLVQGFVFAIRYDQVEPHMLEGGKQFHFVPDQGNICIDFSLFECIQDFTGTYFIRFK